MLASLVLLQTPSQGDMCLEQDPEPPLRGLGGFTESSPPPGLLFLAVFKRGARGARWGGDRAVQAEREEVG